MKNLPPFYIGQTVEYITGINMPKGTKVIVTEVHQESCGCWMIDFKGNSNTNLSIGTHCICNLCSKPIIVTSINAVWDAKSFKAVQELPFPSLTYKKVVEKESELISLN